MQIQLLCLHVVADDDELSFCHKTRVDFAQFRSFGFKLHIEPSEEQQQHCWWFLGDNSPHFIVVWPPPFFEVCCIELLLVYAKIQSSGCCCCIGYGGCVLYLEQHQMYQPVAAVVVLGSSCRAPTLQLVLMGCFQIPSLTGGHSISVPQFGRPQVWARSSRRKNLSNLHWSLVRNVSSFGGQVSSVRAPVPGDGNSNIFDLRRIT